MVLDTLVKRNLDATKYELVTELDKHIFRAYDIRGIVDRELNEHVYYTVGKTIGAVLVEKQKNTILLGFDARLSSEALAKALACGLQDSGIDVISIGLVPSPVLYFAFQHLNVDSGVMVTGSHNPKEYNGIKMVVGGINLTDIEIEALYFRAKTQNFYHGNGTFKQVNIIDAYIQKIQSQIQLKRPLKVAIDCGNGVAGAFAGKLFKAIGAEVLELYCQVDGRFPNHHPDPSIKDNMLDLIDLVLQQQCDIGLAFDGDADRLGVVTACGQIIWPDRQLILLAQDVLKRNPGATIIYDVKCSSLVKQAVTAAGGSAIMSPTGHSIVKKVMRQTGALLAGEMSGHIFIKEKWSGFDDGLYSAARLLAILADSNKTVSAQFAEIPDRINTPELKIAVAEHQKFHLMTKIIDSWQFDDGQTLLIDGLRWQCDKGWGLVRASNTSPYLVVRFEGESEQALQHIQAEFKKRFKEVEPSLVLPF